MEPNPGLSPALAGRARTAMVALIALIATSCDRGDWLGGVERVAREGMSAWGMWSTDAVRPYEDPMPPTPPDTVPTTGKPGFDEARDQWRSLTAAQKEEMPGKIYARHCGHCHGEAGDGRTIVGESFDPSLPDLRSDKAQALTDEQMWNQVAGGTELMVPLEDTLTPLELVLAIRHVRTLPGRESEPPFLPKNTEPID